MGALGQPSKAPAGDLFTSGMIAQLKRLLGSGDTADTQAPPDLRVATCAVLLEAAESDQDFPPEERETIVSVLRKEYGLSPDEVESLILETQRERARATDLWPFTNAISRAYTPEQKRALLVMVWRVIFADGRLDPYEDQLAHRLERLIGVNHSVLMEAKQLARDQLPATT